MIDPLKLVVWVLVVLWHRVEFPNQDVAVFFKEICQVGNILEESRFHKSLLVLDAWHLRDFVDEVKDTRRYADDLVVHHLEQFSQKQCALVDEIY